MKIKIHFVCVLLLVLAPVAISNSNKQLDKSLRLVNFEALKLAINDLTDDYTRRYPQGAEYIDQLEEFEKDYNTIVAGVKSGNKQAIKKAARLVALQRKAMLSNPLIDFDKIIVIKRSAKNLALPKNWESNSSIPRGGIENEIMVLSLTDARSKLTTLYKPQTGKFVGDIDLHFNGDRLLFSMPAQNNRWGIFEFSINSATARRISLIDQPDVDNYDACYLPDGNIIFSSTAPFVGVPCVQGSSHVANLYHLNRQTKDIRRLTFGQDHDWCPTVLNSGKVMYLHWEYSDIPHFVSRILFQMNPDGTSQMLHYGSNSYWPNAMFYARPIPNHPTEFVAVVGGHHDVSRMGEMILFDPAKGRFEADGVVQRISQRGKKVEPKILDGLVRASWPKFLHPYPLSEKYFIVSAKPSKNDNWGIYMVDIFDNMTLIAERDGYVLFEPTPVRKRPAPPVIPERVDPSRTDAIVYLEDVYSGPGLKGVPRGEVKELRVFTYHFAYHGMGGQQNRVGFDGPWDIKRIMGTVPVETDGSAMFRIPANTPISIQPLDSDGKALQLMRSWMTAMPGEVVSCVGCHQRQNAAPVSKKTIASEKQPATIKPWYGPVRGFSFKREVQPVLDKFCVGCHNGSENTPLDLRPAKPVAAKYGANFSPSYWSLIGFVRSHTIESDMHLLPPGEFHADTTELIQMLNAGHHGVKLDKQAWDRLITWIDLNTPAHGTWTEIVGNQKVSHQNLRRSTMLKRYANLDENPEAIYKSTENIIPIVPARPKNPPTKKITSKRWPFDAAVANQRQELLGSTDKIIDIGKGGKLKLVAVPSGNFIMADSHGQPELIEIDKPFWIGAFEITNRQYNLFDPAHDSRLEHGEFLQFSIAERGYPLNAPDQPVVRVSWQKAVEFCQWLSARTGMDFSLPSQHQWEYACRAGAATDLWYGNDQDNFVRFANLADASFKRVDSFPPFSLPLGALDPWNSAIENVNDKYKVSAPVGSFQPNPWGLHDTHGNVAEWTISEMGGRKIVRGGAWSDRPKRAASSFKISYKPYFGIYNVGFRVTAPYKSDNSIARAE